MKLNIVPARTGVLWVRLGIRVFLRQPLALTGLFVMSWLVLSLLLLIPTVGPIASMVLVPASTLGFMVATSDVVEGRMPTPSRLVAGFRQGPSRTRALLQLGFMHALIVMLILLAVHAVFPDSPAATPAPASTDPALQMQMPATWQLVAMAVQMPVSILFCYAPALSHWHGIPAIKALFFSVVAMWRNLGAFTLFGLGWAAVSLVLVSALGLAFALAGTGLLLVLVVPTVLALSAMMLASTYFTFRDSFSADPPGDPESQNTPGGVP